MIIRLLVSGIDDGYFPVEYKKNRGKTTLVSVTYNGFKIYSIDFDLISVDGEDAGLVFEKLEKGDICILDGITFGGFNYINPDLIKTDYIIFYSSRPNLAKVSSALIKHFNDNRKNVILNVMNNLLRISTKKGDVFIYTNIKVNEAKEIIEKYQVFDKIPEPLKTAHEISSSLSKFLLSKKII